MTEPDRVPVERYYDRDFAEFEQRYLWSRTWQMACRLEELPDLGDYVEYAVGDQSVLLVRTDTDTVAGYLNACRHRATELAKGTGTFPRGQIICPFHGWRWNLDGTSSFVFGPHAFDPSLITAEELCLRPVRVETWGGGAWINLDPSAPPLLEALDPIPGLLDPLGVADMRVVWWKSVVLPANWKMAQEAFMEGYHVPGTHPQLTLGHPEQYDPDSLSYAVHPNGHSSFQLRPNAQAKKGRDVGVNEIDAILESVHLLSKGLEAMTLEREVHIIEAMRGRPVPEGSTFGAEMIRALYRYAGAAGIPLPAPDPATLARWGGMFFCSPTTSSSPSTATPSSTGRGRTATTRNGACSSCGRSPFQPPTTRWPGRSSRARSNPTTPTTGHASPSRTSPTSAASNGASTAGASTPSACPGPTRAASPTCTASSTATWLVLTRPDLRPQPPSGATNDVVVVGSGAAALSAALAAQAGGARVTVVERTQSIGGTTAVSGGGVWMPRNDHMAEVGMVDSRPEALAYMGRLTAGRTPTELLEHYVDQGPGILAHLERFTPLAAAPHDLA